MVTDLETYEADVIVVALGADQDIASPRPFAPRFVPDPSRPTSFTYQWVERNGSTAQHPIFVRLQWRSPSGSVVHLLRGDMSLLYTTETCRGAS